MFFVCILGIKQQPVIGEILDDLRRSPRNRLCHSHLQTFHIPDVKEGEWTTGFWKTPKDLSSYTSAGRPSPFLPAARVGEKDIWCTESSPYRESELAALKTWQDVPNDQPTYSDRTSSSELGDGPIQHLCMPCAASNLGDGHEAVPRALLTLTIPGLRFWLADFKTPRILEGINKRNREGKVERVQRGPVRCVKKTKESCPFEAARLVMSPFSLSHAIVTCVCITFMTRKETKEESTAVQQQGKCQKHKYENKNQQRLLNKAQ
ncbi:hypothetical protein M436DRAFT_61839 [Aureobasidium namibiae CBS 147.97]|uniref:Uncharacterized protein n=1 Tax=Aureobasidium namibiae CBS 147.97 TaxID=1043004 RepID=A0A074WQK6_9PEZI|nr:uncharacterized protein M436DRAFT_61839 [Aureobasidium namibiae CBS 147.97]KEQ75433.1 hypothetical protein M436DRAFT_61839 [Aureobasidium namibiae CBS 147.97]